MKKSNEFSKVQTIDVVMEQIIFMAWTCFAHNDSNLQEITEEFEQQTGKELIKDSFFQTKSLLIRAVNEIITEIDNGNNDVLLTLEEVKERIVGYINFEQGE